MRVDGGTREPGGADEVGAARDALRARGVAGVPLSEHVSDPPDVAAGIASIRQGEAMREDGAETR